jgi:LysM repeat protein
MPVNRRARAFAVGSILAVTVGLFSLEYTVKRGDTMGEIARDHGVSVSDLAAANDITNPDLIRPGKVLLIPGKDGEPDRYHLVARGETLIRIASSYGSNAISVARANALRNPDLIFPGQQLLIPASSSGGGSSSGDGESQGSTDSSPSNKRSGQFHVVKRGETVESIAKKHSVSAEDIARANGISNGTIYTGTRLFLDGPSFIGTGSSGSGKYEVKSGDRLGDIAARFGTTVSKLVELNDLANANVIRAGQSLEVPGGSDWVCPLEDSRYFNDWGFPRGSTRYHEGNDMFASYGSPVLAPVSGTVELKRGALGGLQFNLHGTDGVEYLGSHLDSAGKTGKVSAGDVIGYVGNSGNAQGTKPHLHFGMYLDGLAINPHPTLRANDC